MDDTSNRIGEARERRGMRQAELAALLGISRGQVANMESGTREVNLRELRRIARILHCSVSDLLMADDAPGMPDEDEAKLLADLRAMDGYDPRAILTAARAVIAATRTVGEAQAAPQQLRGDPRLAQELAERWGSLDDEGRRKTLQLLDTARSFRN